MIYALDSDIISYMLKGDKDILLNFGELISGNNDYSIPPIVYYEVQRGLTDIRATKKLKEFDELYKYSLKKEMPTEAWEKAVGIWVNLKRIGRLIGDDDIFIAAFCIINGYTLITNNIKHYSNISELKTVNIV